MSKLEIKNLTKLFGQNRVLNDITFSVNEGEFLALLGPSGCGKTTILKIITGLEQPDSGDVFIDGVSILKTPTEKRNIGMAFQNYALFPHMNVFNNVAYGLKIRKKNKKEIKKEVEQVLNLVHMNGMEDRGVMSLSGGQQQRVALARALVIKPDILLLDEPLSALDRKIRTEMQTEIRYIQQKLKITTVFVTHDQEEAMMMSDKIILLNNGYIEQNSDPVTMYNNPVSIFASDFLGRANILNGKVRKIDDGFLIEGSGWSFNLGKKAGVTDGMNVSAVIRDENFKVSTVPHSGACEAYVLKKTFAGPLCRIKIQLGGDLAEIVMFSKDAVFYENTKVYISVNPQDIHLYSDKGDIIK